MIQRVEIENSFLFSLNIVVIILVLLMLISFMILYRGLHGYAFNRRHALPKHCEYFDRSLIFNTTSRTSSHVFFKDIAELNSLIIELELDLDELLFD